MALVQEAEASLNDSYPLLCSRKGGNDAALNPAFVHSTSRQMGLYVQR